MKQPKYHETLKMTVFLPTYPLNIKNSSKAFQMTTLKLQNDKIPFFILRKICKNNGKKNARTSSDQNKGSLFPLNIHSKVKTFKMTKKKT